MKVKVLVIFMAVVFLIPLVSAGWEWDNCKEYDAENKEVTIKNSFCFGSEVSTIKLVNAQPYCIPDKCYLYYEVEHKQGDNKMHKGSKAYDPLTNKGGLNNKDDYIEGKENQYEIWDDNKGWVQTYNECGTDGVLSNGSNNYQCEEKTRNKTGDWIDYDISAKYGIGNFTIREKVDINQGESIDVVPEYFGLDIEEWQVTSGLVRFSNQTLTENTYEYSHGVYRTAFSFNVTRNNSNWILQSVEVYMRGQGSTIDYNLSISPTLSQEPNIANIINSTTQSVTEPNPYGWVTINNFPNTTLEYGVQYAIDVHFPSATGGRGMTGKTSNVYGNGAFWYSTDSGSSWASPSTSSLTDGIFALWGTELIPDTAPTVTLNSPADNFKGSETNLTFNCSATDDLSLANLSLFIDDVINHTVTNTTASQTSIGLEVSNNFADGSYNWTCKASDTTGQQTTASTRDFTIDATQPVITITDPQNIVYPFSFIGKIHDLNWTISDANLDTCFYNYNSSNVTINCGLNHTTFVLVSNQYNITIHANDTYGNVAQSSVNWSYTISENNQTFTTPVYETQNTSFTLNISTGGSESVNANLIYNGTLYTSKKIGTDAEAEFITSFDVPLGTGTKQFFWNITHGSTEIHTNKSNQTINELKLTECGNGASGNPHIVDFVAKDEVTDLPLNFTLPNVNWVYWLGSGAVNKSLSNYVNNSVNVSFHDFCINPQDKMAVYQTIDLQYEAVGYPQRRWGATDTRPFNGADITTLNQTLYLLATADGADVTIVVLSASGAAIESVFVNVTRQVGGVNTLVGSGDTGSDGALTFFLNGDFLHTFTFEKEGFPTLVTSFFPTQPTYTIYLGETAGGNETYDFVRGVSTTIRPPLNFLNNGTDYTFEFTLNSTFWTLTDWGFVMRNGSGTILGSNISSLITGGNLSLALNTANHTSIVMDYFWNIDGNYSNASRGWAVLNEDNFGYGLKTFFDDLKSYTAEDGEGMFGLTPLSLFLIIFTFIFLVVGGIAMTTGLYSPMALIMQTWLLVFLFDIVFGIFPSPNPDFLASGIPTIIVGIIAVAIMLRENMR